MLHAGRFVKGTGSDAIGAVRAVGHPKIQTGFSIDMPGHDPLTVGDVVGLCRRIAVHDALAGAFFGAFFTDQAKIPYAEFNGLIGN